MKVNYLRYINEIKHIERDYGIDLLAKGRTKIVVQIRNLIMFILREKGLSFTEIGKIFHKDHTTVMHSVRKMEDINREEIGYLELRKYFSPGRKC